MTLKKINYTTTAHFNLKQNQAKDAKYLSMMSRPQSSLTIGIVVGTSIWNIRAEPSGAMLEENSILAALIASRIAQ